MEQCWFFSNFSLILFGHPYRRLLLLLGHLNHLTFQIVDFYMIFQKKLSNSYLTDEYLVSNVIVRTNNLLMLWCWYPICTRWTRLTGLLVIAHWGKWTQGYISLRSFLPITVSIDNKWNNFDFFLIFSRFGSVIHTVAYFLILSI
jgi:hypothetical protein